jgi:hypothetical protein
MKIEDILTNLEITCDQNNIDIQDVVLLHIIKQLNLSFYGYTTEQLINKFRLDLQEEHDTLWDLQPAIEDDEDHAFAVQHARDIYNVLVGRELC